MSKKSVVLCVLILGVAVLWLLPLENLPPAVLAAIIILGTLISFGITLLVVVKQFKRHKEPSPENR